MQYDGNLSANWGGVVVVVMLTKRIACAFVGLKRFKVLYRNCDLNVFVGIVMGRFSPHFSFLGTTSLQLA